MRLFRSLGEGLARKTTRRRLFGRGAEVATGALLGVAAGSLTRPNAVAADHLSTACFFPGPPCPCEGCRASGVCAKPCIIMTLYYASGCWVAGHNGATCCDCDCNGFQGFQVCGCGSDYHNNPTFCPNGNADG